MGAQPNQALGMPGMRRESRSEQFLNCPGNHGDAYYRGSGHAEHGVEFVFIDGHGWLSIAAVSG
jgi:hypothetical protein